MIIISIGAQGHMQANLKQQIKLIFANQPVTVYGRGVYRQDFQSLRDYQWLRSQSIGLMTAILQHQYSQLFSPLTSQEDGLQPCKIIDPFVTSMLITMGSQSYILESMEGQRLFSYRYLMFPTNTQSSKGSHWFLMIYDTVANALYTMDSASTAIHDNARIMGKRLLQLRTIFKADKHLQSICVKRSNKTELNSQVSHYICRQFSISSLKNVVRQPNNFDCGIYTIGNIQNILIQLKKKQQNNKINKLQNKKQINKQQLTNIEKNKQEDFDILDIYKINLGEIKQDQQFFRNLRLRYFRKALQILETASKQGTKQQDKDQKTS